MPSYRTEKASGFILEEITLLMREAVRDPRVQQLTVTDVQLTPDRRVARIYVASYAGEEALREGLQGLESASGFLRRGLSRVLHWRFTPELQFYADRSWEYGSRVDEILQGLDIKDEQDEADVSDGGQ